MGDYEMFKTTLMGGFDKDDVMQKVEELKDSAFREKKRLEKELKEGMGGEYRARLGKIWTIERV